LTNSILVIGRLPPPIGGTTVSFETLTTFLQAYENYKFFDLSSLYRSDQRIINFIKFLVLLAQSRCWSFHVSDSAAINILPLFYFLSKITKKKFIYRQFGGSIIDTYSGANFIKKYFFRKLIKGCAMCYFQTEYIIRFFQNICPESNIKWLPTHRPSIKYIVDRTRFNKQKLQIVYIGRIHSVKGVSSIISVCANIEYVDLALYGPVESDCDIDLSILPSNVVYGGVLERSEISQVLLKSDLMLLVSSHKGEGYAGAIIEAIQTQTPMILSDIRPFREILSEAQAIFLSEGDAARLKIELLKLRNNREILKELSSNLAKIRNDFDCEVILRRLHKEHCVCVD